MQNRDILFPGRRPHEQREERVVRAKLIFSTCYGRRSQASLDPRRLTEDQLVQITLDYAENRREYRQMVRRALEEEYYGSPRKLGAAVTDVLRVFDRTLFWYVVRRLPEDLQAKWEAIKSSNDRSLQGFCKYVVPDPVERANLFAKLREDTSDANNFLQDNENDAAPDIHDNILDYEAHEEDQQVGA